MSADCWGGWLVISYLKCTFNNNTWVPNNQSLGTEMNSCWIPSKTIFRTSFRVYRFKTWSGSGACSKNTHVFWEVAKWNNTRLYLCMQGNIKIVSITDNLFKSLWTNESPYFSDGSSKIQSNPNLNLNFGFTFWKTIPRCFQDQFIFILKYCCQNHISINKDLYWSYVWSFGCFIFCLMAL